MVGVTGSFGVGSAGIGERGTSGREPVRARRAADHDASRERSAGRRTWPAWRVRARSSAGPDGVEVVEWWSSDDAERWTRAGSVPIAAARIGDAALAWNDLREAFEGAVEYDDTITGRTRIALLPQVSAEPCAGFELHDVGYDAGEVTVRLDPAANLLGVTHTGEDELRLLLRIEGSTGIGWRTLVSPPSRDRLTSDGAPEAVTSALADVSAVQFRGSDRFGIFASVREQAAVVERREGWARLAPVLVPSEEAGSFDALSLETARLLLDEPQGPRAVAAGQVVYSAPYSSDDCSDCTRIGTARFCVAPLGRGAECDAVLAGRD
ncbi:MAG: hypothetical protein M5U28_05810 [Sandaracinaceae bacterium]|nr:hypothetical protein [Sandaracinaceae bacterium]